MLSKRLFINTTKVVLRSNGREYISWFTMQRIRTDGDYCEGVVMCEFDG